jgi:hypothetical protein
MGVQIEKPQHEQMVSVFLGRKNQKNNVITLLSVRSHRFDFIEDDLLSGCIQPEK